MSLARGVILMPRGKAVWNRGKKDKVSLHRRPATRIPPRYIPAHLLSLELLLPRHGHGPTGRGRASPLEGGHEGGWRGRGGQGGARGVGHVQGAGGGGQGGRGGGLREGTWRKGGRVYVSQIRLAVSALTSIIYRRDRSSPCTLPLALPSNARTLPPPGLGTEGPSAECSRGGGGGGADRRLRGDCEGVVRSWNVFCQSDGYILCYIYIYKRTINWFYKLVLTGSIYIYARRRQWWVDDKGSHLGSGAGPGPGEGGAREGAEEIALHGGLGLLSGRGRVVEEKKEKVHLDSRASGYICYTVIQNDTNGPKTLLACWLSRRLLRSAPSSPRLPNGVDVDIASSSPKSRDCTRRRRSVRSTVDLCT